MFSPPLLVLIHGSAGTYQFKWKSTFKVDAMVSLSGIIFVYNGRGSRAISLLIWLAVGKLKWDGTKSGNIILVVYMRMEGSTYRVIREEIYDKSKSITTILAELNSKDLAESQLVQAAQKNGGKFEMVGDGFYLVRKDNVIEEYKSTIKINKPGWITGWVYSPTNEVDLQLISKYYIKACKPDDLNCEHYSDRYSDHDVLRIVASVKRSGAVTYGFHDCSSSISIKPCTIDEIRQSLEINKKSNVNDDIMESFEFLDTLPNREIREDDNQLSPDSETLARKFTLLLSDSRANDTVSWMQLCYALHNISENLLDCFIEFSKRSNKYDHMKCMDTWHTMRNQNFDLTSLREWAKEDNLVGYLEIMNPT
jgi:hypothetical protein